MFYAFLNLKMFYYPLKSSTLLRKEDFIYFSRFHIALYQFMSSKFYSSSGSISALKVYIIFCIPFQVQHQQGSRVMVCLTRRKDRKANTVSRFSTSTELIATFALFITSTLIHYNKTKRKANIAELVNKSNITLLLLCTLYK